MTRTRSKLSLELQRELDVQTATTTPSWFGFLTLHKVRCDHRLCGLSVTVRAEIEWDWRPIAAMGCTVRLPSTWWDRVAHKTVMDMRSMRRWTRSAKPLMQDISDLV